MNIESTTKELSNIKLNLEWKYSPMPTRIYLLQIAVVILTSLLGNLCIADTVPQKTLPQTKKIKTINNADLIPKIKNDDKVKLESSGTMLSPDWVKSLIIVEVKIQTASENGMFSGMTRALDHLREMGVNGIWVMPIHNGPHPFFCYGNYGIHTLNPNLTGEKDPEQGWKAVKAFVDEAHKRNIRVFFDIVTWGTTKDAPLYKEKPEWYTGKSVWGGWEWDWKNKELCEWFSSKLVDFIQKTGADGFRCDCGPAYSGYDIFRVAREQLLSQGRKVIFISENSSERKSTFDFDQHPACGDEAWRDGDRLLRRNIMDIVKDGDGDCLGPTKGRERFYAFQLSCHDCVDYAAHGNSLAFGYQAIFSPFIPIWYLGEAWNNPYHPYKAKWPYNIGVTTIDWSKLAQNRNFFERVKKMLRIRRQHPRIFEYFPKDYRDINICKVKTNRHDCAPAYARYNDDKAIIVVPNTGTRDYYKKFDITIPYKKMGFDTEVSYEVIDLLNDSKLASGKPAKLASFEADIKKGELGVYLARKLKPRQN